MSREQKGAGASGESGPGRNLEGGLKFTLDPKGELYGRSSTAYALDCRDRVPLCKGGKGLAREIASLMVNQGSPGRADEDPFWVDAEIEALASIILHVPVSCDEEAAAVILQLLESKKISGLSAEMQNSPDPDAKRAWRMFTRLTPSVQALVLSGLAAKCGASYSSPQHEREAAG